MSRPSPHPQWQLRSTGPQLTAFNRSDGTRVSFGPTPQRLRAPELLDIKLTDVCSVGCAFCYQDSRPGRSHARLEDVAYIAHEAGKAGVFEVALGGGEVSEYPHFFDTLHLFRNAGVVPNFTTRRMKWLARQWAEVHELVGGVAVSLSSAAEIRLLSSLIPATERRSGQLVAQVVMGTVERPELLALMQAAGAAEIRVTLLGFKDVGRGQTFRPLPYGWWLDDLPQYVAHTQVSIDTALAAECPAELERLLLPGSYHTEEGRFSAYADAVSMTLAPSSYHAGPAYPFDAEWLTHFAAPNFVQGPSTPPTTGRVRLGFATNSSSSHSLVLLKADAQLKDSTPLSNRDHWISSIGGWGRFIVTNEEAKRHYLAACFHKLIPDSEICQIFDLPSSTDLTGYRVDWQSNVNLTIHSEKELLDSNRLNRIKAIYLNPRVAILGESDFESAWENFQSYKDSITLDLGAAYLPGVCNTTDYYKALPVRQLTESEEEYLIRLTWGEKAAELLKQLTDSGLSLEEAFICISWNENTIMKYDAAFQENKLEVEGVAKGTAEELGKKVYIQAARKANKILNLPIYDESYEYFNEEWFFEETMYISEFQKLIGKTLS